MKIIAVLLMALIVVKDASHLGDRFVMRGIIQGACLAYGLLWVLSNVGSGWFTRYLPVWCYVGVLFISACASEFFGFSAWQVLSLLSVILFCVAICERRRTTDISGALRNATGWVYLLVCTVSLAAMWVAPDLVYQTEVAGGRRFSGLFGRPAMLGEAAGILVGVAMFGKFGPTTLRTPLRLVALSLGAVCLLLSGARTFWVGTAVATAVTSWFYLRYRLRTYLLVAVLMAFCALVAGIAHFHVSAATQKNVLRTESIDNLTGRTAVWSDALHRVAERPWLGYGFAAGGYGVATDYTRSVDRAGPAASVPTFHNGYVQSLVDSGILGTTCYVLIVVLAFWRMMIRDRQRNYGAEMFGLVFLAVANMGESVIFTAATFPSIFYWYTAVLALSLRQNEGRAQEPARRAIPGGVAQPLTGGGFAGEQAPFGRTS